MKILITGGAGFIGSHLCDKYTQEGHTVLCFDNFMTGDLRNVRHLLNSHNFKLIKGDVRDQAALSQAMRDIDVIFHLAAQVHVDRSYIEPRMTYDVNVMGTQNVLDLARMNDVRRVIYASTSEVYGSAQYVPINEEHPLAAPHPYGASKIAADRMCYAYSVTYGMDIAILRFFNIFGPRQRDAGYGGVISIFTRRILSNMSPIIYGDGHQTRDYTHVADAVEAYDCALRYEGPLAEPVNFGGGQEISILDLANHITDICGKNGEIQPTHAEPRIGEVKRLIADASRAKALFGWTPGYDLVDGLRAFVSWYREHGFEESIKFG